MISHTRLCTICVLSIMRWLQPLPSPLSPFSIHTFPPDTEGQHQQQVSNLISSSSLISSLTPLPKNHTGSRPGPPRLCWDDPDGRGFHEVPVNHLVLLGSSHCLQFRWGFWAPVGHELILGLTVVHHHFLRLLPKQPIWKTEREGRCVGRKTLD